MFLSVRYFLKWLLLSVVDDENAKSEIWFIFKSLCNYDTYQLNIDEIGVYN